MRLKVQVKGPTTTYTYNLTPQQWTVFPLSDGTGSYQVTVYKNVKGTKYATVLSAKFKVILTDEFAPFLRPNQYVDYLPESKIVEKAAELTKDMTDPLEKVKAVNDFVMTNLTYDKEKAVTVKSGYLPVLDTVLEEKKEICFDYAALMTGMLRSQGVPCKLVVGYAGSVYHAWISVWTEESGWIDGAIFFNGSVWIRIQLSTVLRTVVSQQLLPDVHGGLVPAYEIMHSNSAIRSMIRDNKNHQIDKAIASGACEGMVSMDQAITALYRAGKITRETALDYADRPDQLLRSLG